MQNSIRMDVRLDAGAAGASTPLRLLGIRRSGGGQEGCQAAGMVGLGPQDSIRLPISMAVRQYFNNWHDHYNQHLRAPHPASLYSWGQ